MGYFGEKRGERQYRNSIFVELLVFFTVWFLYWKHYMDENYIKAEKSYLSPDITDVYDLHRDMIIFGWKFQALKFSKIRGGKVAKKFKRTAN